MLREQCKVGMTVSFGRGRGAHTKGRVLKVNEKKAKVETLEQRNSNAAGTIWNVPYSLLTAVEWSEALPVAPKQAQPYPNGLTITGVRYLTGRECEQEGWEGGCDPAVALTMSDGSMIFASQDYEGNGPGALFGRMRTGEQFILSPAQKEVTV
jgi:hypothetical protein